MSVLIHCDSPACNSTRPEQADSHRWIYVEDHGVVAATWGSTLRERELHFCSWECVLTFHHYGEPGPS